ncbi:SDR family oxidoreductase [Salipaludibacillus agaradhaerens]|uniref:SDR family oxidoreductase n=1 Tax=Salipaludibacillus agaradhaerens TaxID=76935 RepID=UPI0021507B08|nr:SDR family NAD(P)-dependent oxidoreductase [Salipaludibacillus agaradhaerens]MCR6107772.1 SDR family oxidoreductase [Salipaludibacillus agaradhaerens]MCR6119801.1 SDR family oxidoreductase [Salipaludibacillus agaradhaerens]
MEATEFSSKVVLITGAASGIGLAAAKRFTQAGAHVCMLDINEQRLKEAEKDLQSYGTEILPIACDISDDCDVQAAIEKATTLWGRLDIVFANAGIGGMMAPIEQMTVVDWKKTIDVDLTGCFLTVKYAIPWMKTHGGSIIMTSSVSGNRVYSQPGFSSYSTAKAGQTAFMKMAALELGQFGIRVNAVCPGSVDTHITEQMRKHPEVDNISMQVAFPRGRQPLMQGSATPDQVVDAVEFLASAKSGHITGTELYIDGGESLLQG